MAKEIAVSTTTPAVSGPVYRFGDAAGERGIPAYTALNQVFSALILSTGSTLDSEWVLVQAGATVGFVDLFNGTFVPVTSVLYAVPL